MPSKGPWEREHIIRWCDADEDPLHVYTHRESVAKRLLAGGASLKRVSRIGGRVVSWTLECPREWIRWPRPRKKREVSEKQRETARALGRVRGGVQKASSTSVDKIQIQVSPDDSPGTASDPSEGR